LQFFNLKVFIQNFKLTMYQGAMAQAGRAIAPQLVMVDTDLRRSLRIKAFNIDFKAPGCGKGNCLDCELDPLSNSTRVIKNLGRNFIK
jgi:hypothetical protein